MKFAPPNATRKAPRLQLIAMIDVIFLLLIFFMASMTLSPPESHLAPALQREHGGASAMDFQPQIVEVTVVEGAPAYKIGSRVLREKAALVAALRPLPKEIGVFVKVDGALSVGFVAAGMQACRDAGFTKVTYVPAQ